MCITRIYIYIVLLKYKRILAVVCRTHTRLPKTFEQKYNEFDSLFGATNHRTESKKGKKRPRRPSLCLCSYFLSTHTNNPIWSCFLGLVVRSVLKLGASFWQQGTWRGARSLAFLNEHLFSNNIIIYTEYIHSYIHTSKSDKRATLLLLFGDNNNNK